MATKEHFLKLLEAAFPPQPMPARFFWKEVPPGINDEFHRDLLEWLAGRQWTEIKMRNWTMMAHVGIIRELLAPATFLYYLPSLLLAVSEDPSYLDDALAAIIPSGRDRRPKNQWWGELLETVSPEQAAAIRAFLAYVRSDLLRSDKEPFVVSEEEVHTDEAERFWDAQIASLTSRTNR